MKFQWPFARETRQDSSYTDAIVAQIQARASGTTAASESATAALEAVSGLVGRAFASADVEARDGILAALTPDLLAMVGRALVRRGEFVALVDVNESGLRLLPAQTHDVGGGPDPATWSYQVTLGGPGQTLTYNGLPASAVIHVRYAVDPARPWKGIGPIQAASLAGRLSAETAAALADESSGPRGNLLPIPGVDGDDSTVANLKADIRTLGGKAALVEGGDLGSGQTVRNAWEPQRVGAAPPAALVELVRTASAEIYAACGVNPAVFTDSQGTAAREAYRQVLFGLISPLGKIVSAELSGKLAAPVSLGWDELRAADISGRARAFTSMVNGGMALDRAAALSGLLAAE